MKHFYSLVFIAISTAIAVPALAADQYTIDERHTFPVFEVSHLGFSTQRGRFNKTSGKITLDRAAKKGNIEVNVDTRSIDMGFEEWNKHMRDAKFFNVEKHPTMRFVSTKLIFDGDKLVGANGQFTLLGVTHPLDLKISGFSCALNPLSKKPTCGADISATIKRSEYGMSAYVPAVGDDIKIYSAIEAIKN